MRLQSVLATVDNKDMIPKNIALIDHVVVCVWAKNDRSRKLARPDISVLHLRSHESAHFTLDVEAARVAEEACLPLEVPIFVPAQIAKIPRHDLEARAQAPLRANAQILGPIHHWQLVIGLNAWALKQQRGWLEAFVVDDRFLVNPMSQKQIDLALSSIVNWTLALTPR